MIKKLLDFFGKKTPPDYGRWGEEMAAAHLSKRHGFKILARNWTNPRDNREELDLVCQDGEVLVFVEVKTRSVLANVRGFDAVNGRKKKVLHRAALAYLRQLPHSRRPRSLRLDIVEVNHCGRNVPPEVLHFPNAPLFNRHFQC